MNLTLAEPAAREFVVEHPTVEQTSGAFSIVRVRPRHEKVFVRELRIEGLGYFLPLRLHVRFWHGQRRESYQPIFPTTVFVANGDDGRHFAASSRCVRGFIPVAPSYQPQLRRELTQLETVLIHQPESQAFPELIEGRPVVVRHDRNCPHWAAGLRGKILHRKSGDVFCIEVKFMNRMIEVEEPIPGQLLDVIDAA